MPIFATLKFFISQGCCLAIVATFAKAWVEISGSSSFGRARPCQGRGGRFEPGLPLRVLPFCGRIFCFITYHRKFQCRNSVDALVVKLVDTQDLKSCGQQWPYRFNSDPGHKKKERRNCAQSETSSALLFSPPSLCFSYSLWYPDSIAALKGTFPDSFVYAQPSTPLPSPTFIRFATNEKINVHIYQMP